MKIIVFVFSLLCLLTGKDSLVLAMQGEENVDNPENVNSVINNESSRKRNRSSSPEPDVQNNKQQRILTPEEQEDLNQRLFQSLMWESIETVESLILEGADVNARNANGLVPLHCAVTHGRTDAIQALLNHGANVNSEDEDDNQTALHHAVIRNNGPIVQILVTHHANVNALSTLGAYPLGFAVLFGFTKIIKILLSAGADINFNGNYSFSSFYSAIFNGNLKVIDCLIEHHDQAAPEDTLGRINQEEIDSLEENLGKSPIIQGLCKRNGCYIEQNSYYSVAGLASKLGYQFLLKYLTVTEQDEQFIGIANT